MAYGMQQLRKAGQYLKDFDRAYAEKARGGMVDDDPRIAQYGTPLADIMGSDRARYMAENAQPGQWMGGDIATETVNPWTGAREAAVPVSAIDDLGVWHHRMMDASQMAQNVAVRYGLPAGGLTLAGAGLYDLTASFGNGADYPEEGQLPLS